MKFVSTGGGRAAASFSEAMFSGLAPDGGLYMPADIPVLDDSFLNTVPELDFHSIAWEMAKPYLEDELSGNSLRNVIERAFDFPVRLREVKDGIHILELFHGPTLAFKDFGARFMARLFSEFAGKKGEVVNILVATSGDTGGAVANGFYNVEGVNVCILYPKNKVSPLQEKQMTTLGGNIKALEIDGVFDDCQKLVKQAFRDRELRSRVNVSSANSINIARLLPQSFYYSFAVSRLFKRGEAKALFSVPSGNFGNLTAGLLAQQMGLPVMHFLAATNRNDVVPSYLNGDEYRPRPSVQTLSSAMDVGNPSNFERIKYLFNGDDNAVRNQISGFSYTDDDTLETIRSVDAKSGYLMCPHTAVGYRAAMEYVSSSHKTPPAVVLATAHPAKFREVIEPAVEREIHVPKRLKKNIEKENHSRPMPADYDAFRSFLLESL